MDVDLANELFPVMNNIVMDGSRGGGLDGSRGGLDNSLESGYAGEGSNSMNSSTRSRSSSKRSQSTKSSICGASLQRDLPSHWTTQSESLDIEQQLQTASMIPPRRITRTTTNDATLRESDKAYHSLMKLMATNPNCLYDDNDEEESTFVGSYKQQHAMSHQGRVTTSSSYRRGSNASDKSPLEVINYSKYGPDIKRCDTLDIEPSPSLSSSTASRSSSSTTRTRRIKQCIRVISILILLTVISILLVYLIDESLLNDISTNILGRFVDVKEKKGSDVLEETPHLVTENDNEEESRHREMTLESFGGEDQAGWQLNEEEQYALLLPGV